MILWEGEVTPDRPISSQRAEAIATRLGVDIRYVVWEAQEATQGYPGKMLEWLENGNLDIVSLFIGRKLLNRKDNDNG